jgi:hypothetical protein
MSTLAERDKREQDAALFLLGYDINRTTHNNAVYSPFAMSRRQLSRPINCASLLS